MPWSAGPRSSSASPSCSRRGCGSATTSVRPRSSDPREPAAAHVVLGAPVVRGPRPLQPGHLQLHRRQPPSCSAASIPTPTAPARCRLDQRRRRHLLARLPVALRPPVGRALQRRSSTSPGPPPSPRCSSSARSPWSAWRCSPIYLPRLAAHLRGRRREGHLARPAQPPRAHALRLRRSQRRAHARPARRRAHPRPRGAFRRRHARRRARRGDQGARPARPALRGHGLAGGRASMRGLGVLTWAKVAGLALVRLPRAQRRAGSRLRLGLRAEHPGRGRAPGCPPAPPSA